MPPKKTELAPIAKRFTPAKSHLWVG